MVRADMATDRLREICQGALPPAHLPQLTITGFGVTYPEDPTVLDQCRRLALGIADYEALSPHGRSNSWPGTEGFSRIAGEVAGPVMAGYGPPWRFPKP
eukprot:15484618-Alexandrium_andersonii.AAC.1